MLNTLINAGIHRRGAEAVRSPLLYRRASADCFFGAGIKSAGFTSAGFTSAGFTSAGFTSAGFTKTEMVVTIAIIGVLSAIALPGFLSWLANRTVEEATADVVGTLREAQAEALRLNQGCRVQIDTATNLLSAQTIPPLGNPTAPVTNCLPTGSRQLNEDPQLQLSSSFGANTLNFTYRGTAPTSGIIVVRHQAGTRPRCVVLSEGIGVIRDGFFSGDPATPAIENCRRSP